MVYYLTSHSHAYSSWRATRASWRRVGARERLHRPRGKLGREDGNEKKQLQTSDVRQPTDVRTHDREIANASDIRQISDVRRLGRPKPDGRPTSQLQLGQDPCSKTSTLQLLDVRSTTDVRPIFRTSETQRTFEPSCVQFRALGHVSPSSPPRL